MNPAGTRCAWEDLTYRPDLGKYTPRRISTGFAKSKASGWRWRCEAILEARLAWSRIANGSQLSSQTFAQTCDDRKASNPGAHSREISFVSRVYTRTNHMESEGDLFFPSLCLSETGGLTGWPAFGTKTQTPLLFNAGWCLSHLEFNIKVRQWSQYALNSVAAAICWCVTFSSTEFWQCLG